MEGWKVVNVLNKYKKCPCCGSSNKDMEMKVEIKDNTVRIYCTCGYDITVDENNKEICSIGSCTRGVQLCPSCGKKRKYTWTEEVEVFIDGKCQSQEFYVCNCTCGTRFLVDADSQEDKE